jgi:hypothetical protein
VCILDQKSQDTLESCTVGLEKVQWTCYGPKDATWHDMRVEYLHLFEDF